GVEARLAEERPRLVVAHRVEASGVVDDGGVRGPAGDVARAALLGQDLEGAVVAAHQEDRATVDGEAVASYRAGPAADGTGRLEQHGLDAACVQLAGCGGAGDAAADDDYLHGSSWVLRQCCRREGGPAERAGGLRPTV